MEAMPSGLILLNNRGRVIQINSVALEMFSLRYEQIIGKNLFEFISLDDHIDKEEQMSLLQKEMYNKEVNISRAGSLAQL
ncbi:PAS domain-containing protein [bacterium 210820-DFI.6.37]|nr:PAS domain-containing protein [bacterium 210820-DFI.6.37]